MLHDVSFANCSYIRFIKRSLEPRLFMKGNGPAWQCESCSHILSFDVHQHRWMNADGVVLHTCQACSRIHELERRNNELVNGNWQLGEVLFKLRTRLAKCIRMATPFNDDDSRAISERRAGDPRSRSPPCMRQKADENTQGYLRVRTGADIPSLLPPPPPPPDARMAPPEPDKTEDC